MNQAKKLSEVITGAWEAAGLRHTGKTMEQWNETFKERLLRDVMAGRLNPDAPILLRDLPGLCSTYGFGDGDLRMMEVPIEIVQNYHPREPIPHYGQNGPAKTRIMAMLNRDKYGELRGVYGSKKQRMRLV